MCDGVLNDQRLHAIGVPQRDAKTDGTAVVLHVERVPRQPDRVGEAIDDGCQMIERVRKLGRLWPIAMSEAWIIGRDQMEPVGQARQ